MQHALKDFLELTPTMGQSIAILTDSRSLTTHLEGLVCNPRPVTETILALLDQLTELYSSGIDSISIIWIPGHSNVGLNPIADKEATAAYEDDYKKRVKYPPNGYIRTGKKRLEKAFAEYLKNEIKPSADKNNPSRQAFVHKPFSKFRPRNIRQGRILEQRRAEAGLFRLRAGHSMLATHRFRMNLAESDTCPHCQTKMKQTVDHALLRCPRNQAIAAKSRNEVCKLLKARQVSLTNLLSHDDYKSERALQQLIQDLQQSGVQI